MYSIPEQTIHCIHVSQDVQFHILIASYLDTTFDSHEAMQNLTEYMADSSIGPLGKTWVKLCRNPMILSQENLFWKNVAIWLWQQHLIIIVVCLQDETHEYHKCIGFIYVTLKLSLWFI